MLHAYAQFLKEHFLPEVASENLRLLREMNVPLLRLVAHLSEAELKLTTMEGLGRFLDDLAAGAAVGRAEASLEAWAEDRVPGLAQADVQPSDLVLVFAAQREAVLTFLPRFTRDVEVATGILLAIDRQYRQIQDAVMKVYARVRDQATEEIRRLANDLAREKEFVEALVQHVPAGISFMDRNLVARWANPAAARMFGMRREEVPGQTMFDAPAPEVRDHYIGLIQGVLKDGQVYQGVAMPTTEVGPAGKIVRYWDFTLVPIRDANGAIDGVMACFQDATARVEQEHLQATTIERLREVDRMKDQFLSVLSHELRTPLNAIMGFGSILQDGLAGPLSAEQQAMVGKMLAGSETLMALIDDVLDLSRIRAGKLSLASEPFDAAPLVAEVAASMEGLARRKRITLMTPARGSKTPLVLGDAQRVAQILRNLLGNAIKFTPAGGRVGVTWRQAGEMLHFEVKDSGVGIPVEMHHVLFEPFVQIDMSNTRQAGGTGLGLSITKALVEAHGGHIGFDSEVGAGTTFWFTLPVAAQAIPHQALR